MSEHAIPPDGNSAVHILGNPPRGTVSGHRPCILVSAVVDKFRFKLVGEGKLKLSL